jgi:hypothetical protein
LGFAGFDPVADLETPFPDPGFGGSDYRKFDTLLGHTLPPILADGEDNFSLVSSIRAITDGTQRFSDTASQ